jgi:hypothetical protein
MTTMHATFVKFLALLPLISAAGAAHAGTDPIGHPLDVASTSTPLAKPATPPSYSFPWQLRPLNSGNAVRIESTAAVFNDANGNVDEAVTTMLSASYQIAPHWAPTVRLGFVGNDAPGAALDGSSFVNPLVGATYTRRIGSYDLAVFGATTIPVGTGGGGAPDLRAARTNVASTTARPADSAMFAVDYMTGLVGLDAAYVSHRFTAQAEATLLQSVRVRGASSPAATDSFRTSSAVGLHLGYFIGSHLSLGADLLYQRWLSHPTTANPAARARVPVSDADMDTVTAAAGPRLHFRLGNQVWIHPGLSFVRGFDARGLDAPLLTAQTTAVQIDVPITF